MARKRQKPENSFNTIYDDSVIKYTINIPIELYNKITASARRQRLDRSVVIRSLLERVFLNERPLTVTQMLEREKAATEIFYVDPPRRYHGFIGGLLRNNFVNSWARKRREQRQSALVKNY